MGRWTDGQGPPFPFFPLSGMRPQSTSTSPPYGPDAVGHVPSCLLHMYVYLLYTEYPVLSISPSPFIYNTFTPTHTNLLFPFHFSLSSHCTSSLIPSRRLTYHHLTISISPSPSHRHPKRHPSQNPTRPAAAVHTYAYIRIQSHPARRPAQPAQSQQDAQHCPQTLIPNKADHNTQIIHIYRVCFGKVHTSFLCTFSAHPKSTTTIQDSPYLQVIRSSCPQSQIPDHHLLWEFLLLIAPHSFRESAHPSHAPSHAPFQHYANAANSRRKQLLIIMKSRFANSFWQFLHVSP